jgi:hypothetical protein
MAQDHFFLLSCSTFFRVFRFDCESEMRVRNFWLELGFNAWVVFGSSRGCLGRFVVPCDGRSGRSDGSRSIRVPGFLLGGFCAGRSLGWVRLGILKSV